MHTWVLTNEVLSDGVGDFYHFADVIKKLASDPRYKDIRLVGFVEFKEGGSDTNYKRIENQIQEIKNQFSNIEIYFGTEKDHKKYSTDTNIQNMLGTADQAFTVSRGLSLPLLYSAYLKPDIPLKSIGEHENAICCWPSAMPNPKIDCSLGLSKSSGIKIENVPPIPAHEACDIIQTNEPKLSSELFRATNTSDFNACLEQNIIVPAYYSRLDDFIGLIHLLAMNESVSNGKNIIILASGRGCDTDSNEMHSEFSLAKLKSSSVKDIEIIQSGDESEIIHINPEGLKSIKIMKGFYLNDQAYDALFQLTRNNIAGVSGDNSLERCFAYDILPFYWSTNADNKRPTLTMLQNITQLDELPISDKARQSFNVYFDPQKHFEHADLYTKRRPTNPERPDPYQNVDFQEMLKYWPVVVDYVKKNHNFYEKFVNIMNEGLEVKSLPQHFQSIQKTNSFKDSLLQAKQKEDSLNHEINHDADASHTRNKI